MKLLRRGLLLLILAVPVSPVLTPTAARGDGSFGFYIGSPYYGGYYSQPYRYYRPYRYYNYGYGNDYGYPYGYGYSYPYYSYPGFGLNYFGDWDDSGHHHGSHGNHDHGDHGGGHSSHGGSHWDHGGHHH